MPEKHLSTQFDSELNAVSTRVMELGGLVESQIRQAIYALSQFSVEVANQVTETEARVNAMEVEIDRELSSIIARRQPTARDLRLLIAISKTTANLERVGDEAEKNCAHGQVHHRKWCGRVRCRRPELQGGGRPGLRACCARRSMPLPGWIRPRRCPS